MYEYFVKFTLVLYVVSHSSGTKNNNIDVDLKADSNLVQNNNTEDSTVGTLGYPKYYGKYKNITKNNSNLNVFDLLQSNPADANDLVTNDTNANYSKVSSNLTDISPPITPNEEVSSNKASSAFAETADANFVSTAAPSKFGRRSQLVICCQGKTILIKCGYMRCAKKVSAKWSQRYIFGPVNRHMPANNHPRKKTLSGVDKYNTTEKYDTQFKSIPTRGMNQRDTQFESISTGGMNQSDTQFESIRMNQRDTATERFEPITTTKNIATKAQIIYEGGEKTREKYVHINRGTSNGLHIKYKSAVAVEERGLGKNMMHGNISTVLSNDETGKINTSSTKFNNKINKIIPEEHSANKSMIQLSDKVYGRNSNKSLLKTLKHSSNLQPNGSKRKNAELNNGTREELRNYGAREELMNYGILEELRNEELRNTGGQINESALKRFKRNSRNGSSRERKNAELNYGTDEELLSEVQKNAHGQLVVVDGVYEGLRVSVTDGLLATLSPDACFGLLQQIQVCFSSLYNGLIVQICQ